MNDKIKVLIPTILVIGLTIPAFSGCLGGYPGSAEGVVKAYITDSYNQAKSSQDLDKYTTDWNSTKKTNLLGIEVKDTEEMEVKDLEDEEGISYYSYRSELKDLNGDGEVDEDEADEEIDEDETIKKVEVEVEYEYEDEDGDMEEEDEKSTFYLVKRDGKWRIIQAGYYEIFQ